MKDVTYVIQIRVGQECMYYEDDNCLGNYNCRRGKAKHFFSLEDAKKKMKELDKLKEGPLKIIKVTWENL